jgi:hypothetical protein
MSMESLTAFQVQANVAAFDRLLDAIMVACERLVELDDVDTVNRVWRRVDDARSLLSEATGS